MWPTPTVNGNYNRKGASATSGDGLATAAGGALNPTWVCWLMGWPLGWTRISGGTLSQTLDASPLASNIEPQDCAPSGTARSRSRRRSRG
ncbi:MAG: hypothetical protein D6729_17035 [Deltaproteobacteria bacterium]|nr:MAG: hypothetical protein D6729_17035 [Deltaproteobacteria bacterium]